MTTKKQDSDQFSRKLISWYEANKRHLPWRETRDPYKIWLSEIILQQTRVNQGLPYFIKFESQFETIHDFANAPLDKVLKTWQGLGYYSRARNMHVCAKTIVEELDGQFPTGYEALQKLKGIGKYTAAAIASICFDEVVPTVDGNVYRVLSRIFGLEDDIAETKSFKVFFEQAKKLISPTQPGHFNQALMEYGATVCTPKSPDCSHCIFSNECFAFGKDLVSYLPVKSKKVKIKKRFFHYLVLQHQGNVLIRQRGPKDIWQGLYEFLLQESEEFKPNDISIHLKNQHPNFSSAIIPHQLTHQKILARFHVIEIDDVNNFEQLKKELVLLSVSQDKLHQFPVPKLIETFLKKELNLMPD